MSSDVLKVNGVKLNLVLDERISKQEPQYNILKGGLYSNLNHSSANNFDNSSIGWNISVPSQVYTDRHILMRFECDFVFNYVPGGSALFPLYNAATGYLGGYAGLRFMPMQQQCNALSAQINSTTITSNPSQYIEALTRYGDKYWDDIPLFYQSLYPSVHDVAEYSQTFGTNVSPLGPSNDLNRGVMGRGDTFYELISDDNVLGRAVVRAKWAEYVCMQPFINFRDQEVGLWNIDTLIINMQMNANWSLMWSIDAVHSPAVINSITGSFRSTPILTTMHITPLEVPPPGPHLYSSAYIQDYPKDAGLLNPGQTVTVNLDNARLSSTPGRIYLYSRCSDNTKTFRQSDTYCQITNVQMTFGNINTLINGYSPEELFQMSSKNGLNMSWLDFHRQTGSVVCIDLASDVSMPVEQTVGMGYQQDIKIQLDIKNISSQPTFYVVHMIVIQEGLFVLDNLTSQNLIGVINPSDVTASKVLNSLAISSLPPAASFYGGDLYSNIKRLTAKSKAAYSRAKPYIEKYGPTAKKIAKDAGLAALSLLAAGYDEAEVKKQLKVKYGIPASQAKQLIMASGYTGGKMVPRSKPRMLLTGRN